MIRKTAMLILYHLQQTNTFSATRTLEITEDNSNEMLFTPDVFYKKSAII